MNPIMINIMNSLRDCKSAPKLKRLSEGGFNRAANEVAVDIHESVSPYVIEKFLPESFAKLENIAVMYNIPIRFSGKMVSPAEWESITRTMAPELKGKIAAPSKMGETLVNVGKITRVIDNNTTPENFNNQVMDVVNESLGRKLGK